MRSRTVDLHGPVHFADFGGEGPTMVLVHGLGGSHLDWMAVGPLLARAARVLAVDLAGFGRTPLGGRSADLLASRALLDRFLDAVAAAPAILVGNSMGGLLAIMEAAERPEKVAGLVLAAPAQPRPRGTWVDPLVAAMFTAYALPLLGPGFLRLRALLLRPEQQVQTSLRLCCADPARVAPEVVAALVALAHERRALMPWASAAFIDAIRSLVLALSTSSTFDALVESLTPPALLIQGTKDRLVPLAVSRSLAARRPDWSFEVFEDVGHVPQLEAPERFAAAVKRWLGLARLVASA
jgi:pimeloyl-ACP methyl ester carboxylesterase